MKKTKVLLRTLIVLNLALIWGNSLMNGEASGAVSGGLLAVVGEIFPFLRTESGHTFLRKAAHFMEFCLLGLFSAAQRTASGKVITPAHTGWGVAAACVDETIQLFVPGRAGRVTDVAIDTAGFAMGMILWCFGHKFLQKLPDTSKEKLRQKGGGT